MNEKCINLGLVLFGLVFLETVEADNRAYVWIYEYKTMLAGETELEYYTTFHSPFTDSLEDNTTVEHNIELKIGMNNRFDVGLYQVFEQKPGEALWYKGYKVRFRFRFGEKGQYLMDPLLYVEYRGQPDFSEYAWVGKLILARDFNRLSVALNPIMEIEYDEDKWETKLEYNAGISYRLHPLVGLGLEARGRAHGHYLGPVISLGMGDLWAALGSGFAVTAISDNKPEFMLRLIVGVGLRHP